MAYLLELVEGWTGALPVTLKSDGVAQDLTGSTVVGVLRDYQDVIVDTTGDVTITATTAGGVTYTPDSVDFSASKSPYKLRFRVTSGAGEVVYFPNGEPSLIKVRT